MIVRRDGCQLKSHPRHLAMVQNFEVHRQSSRVAWLPRLPDLNPCDFWLCGYLKDVVFSAPIAHLSEFSGIAENNWAHLQEFVTWKEENKTMSKYVRQRGCKTLQNGEIVMNYHCCRSGTYKPRVKGLKNLKSQGSAKIGTSCPAVIKVIQSTENVVVHYFPKHQNHETQLEHLRLSESNRTAIAGKLKEGVSEIFFLQDIREEIIVDSGRKMLIEKKDIHNIKRDFNINGYVKRHEIDAVSVKLWAE
ncbi:MULE domain-containing protein [Trichonephila clavipes]|nr:MULE domain-containing protein [Trichonephila clavipes]